MDINRLHESRLIALPQKEQGLAWLVENGPLVANPPLPVPVLRSLVKDKRILRLRNGLYLAPAADARLPSLARTINLVDPTGYISGHGALMLHGLNDQDVSRLYTVSNRRQSDISYGLSKVHFVFSPTHADLARRTTVKVQGAKIVVASVAQAIVDELRLMPYGLDFVETARVLRNAFEAGKTTEGEIVKVLNVQPSVATARRLGILLEIVLSRPNPALLALARSHESPTHLDGDSVYDKTWRLYLPRSRDSILRASQ